MYTDMENWAEIRRRVLVDGLSKRAACREYDIHWDTLAEDPRPPRAARIPPHGPPAQAQARPLPARHPPDPRGRQEGPEEAAAHRPPDLRAAPRRARLRRRPDHRQGGRRRLEGSGRPRSSSRWPTRPARPRSTSAQAEVILDGQATKVALFVMTLPYSDAIFVCAFPRECTEAFLEGHVRAFAFFGGVPRRISYDNSKIAVAKIIGSRDRKVTDAFLRLKSHHLFEDHFCLVRRPNEKGHVETLIGFARRSFLVPVPVVHGGLEPLNADLERRCRDDLTRRFWGKPATKAELLDEERPALLPLPAEAFVAARVEPRSRRLAVAGRASTPTSTRSPPSSPTTRSRSSPRWTRSGSSPATAWRPSTAGAGAASRSSTTRCTTWPCSSASPGRWTSRRRWRAGSCRSASASCGGGWRPSSAGRGRGSSSRSCGCWSGPSLGELTRAVERALELGVGRRRRRAADPGAPPGAAGRACSASTAGRTSRSVAVPMPDLSAYASLAAGVAP